MATAQFQSEYHPNPPLLPSQQFSANAHNNQSTEDQSIWPNLIPGVQPSTMAHLQHQYLQGQQQSEIELLKQEVNRQRTLLMSISEKGNELTNHIKDANRFMKQQSSEHEMREQQSALRIRELERTVEELRRELEYEREMRRRSESRHPPSNPSGRSEGDEVTNKLREEVEAMKRELAGLAKKEQPPPPPPSQQEQLFQMQQQLQQLQMQHQQQQQQAIPQSYSQPVMYQSTSHLPAQRPNQFQPYISNPAVIPSSPSGFGVAGTAISGGSGTYGNATARDLFDMGRNDFATMVATAIPNFEHTGMSGVPNLLDGLSPRSRGLQLVRRAAAAGSNSRASSSHFRPQSYF